MEIKHWLLVTEAQAVFKNDHTKLWPLTYYENYYKVGDTVYFCVVDKEERETGLVYNRTVLHIVKTENTNGGCGYLMLSPAEY